MFGAQAAVGIPQYNMIIYYDLKGYTDQSALLYQHQIIVDASFDAVDGDIVLNFKKFLVEEGGNDIIIDGPQNFIYSFSDTVGEGHGLNRGKAVINVRSGRRSKFSDTNQV